MKDLLVLFAMGVAFFLSTRSDGSDRFSVVRAAGGGRRAVVLGRGVTG